MSLYQVKLYLANRQTFSFSFRYNFPIIVSIKLPTDLKEQTVVNNLSIKIFVSLSTNQRQLLQLCAVSQQNYAIKNCETSCSKALVTLFKCNSLNIYMYKCTMYLHTHNQLLNTLYGISIMVINYKGKYSNF